MHIPHDSSPMELSELEEILREIGLNEKESKIYLELLHLGEGFPGHISSKTGINRTVVYSTLKRLCELNLAEMKNKWGQQCFVAKNCEAFLNTQKNRYDEKIKKIERARRINLATKKLSETKPKDELNIFCDIIIENISLRTKPAAAAIFIKNERTKRAEVKAITSTKLGEFTLNLLKGRFFKLSTPYEAPIDNVGLCLKEKTIIKADTLKEYICPTVSEEIAEKIIKMGAGPAIIIPLKEHGAILFSYKSKEEIKRKSNEINQACKKAEKLIDIYFQNKRKSEQQMQIQKKVLNIFKKLNPKLKQKEKEAIRCLEKEIRNAINNPSQHEN